MSSLAFAPTAEKQVQCNALGFLNSCPSAETRQSAKLSEGEQGLRGGPRRGEGGGARSAVGTRGVGVRSRVPALRATWGRSRPLGPLGCGEGGEALAGRGCPEWGSGTPARWATLGTPGPWAGWGAGKGGRPGREAQEGRGGSSCACRQGAGAVQRSHAGRERRVAGSAQTVLLQCGFQGAPPS